MRTDELIARLAENPEPVRPPLHTLARGLIGGAFVALAFTAIVLGLRRDLPEAVRDWQYWAKFAYPLALAALAFPLVERLSRPGLRAGHLARDVLAPFVVLALLALWQWSATPVEQHPALLFGRSFLVCPWLIALVSLPVLIGMLWSMRQLAPTRAAPAGAAAGLFAGAMGAWIYAFHCHESSLVFVAVWYTAGIALSGILGALIGQRMLRW